MICRRCWFHWKKHVTPWNTPHKGLMMKALPSCNFIQGLEKYSIIQDVLENVRVCSCIISMHICCCYPLDDSAAPLKRGWKVIHSSAQCKLPPDSMCTVHSASCLIHSSASCLQSSILCLRYRTHTHTSLHFRTLCCDAVFILARYYITH